MKESMGVGARGAGMRLLSFLWLGPLPLQVVVVVVYVFMMMMPPILAMDLSGLVTAFSGDPRPLVLRCPAGCRCATRHAQDLMQDHLSHYLPFTAASMDPQLEPQLRSTLGVMTSWLGMMADIQCRLSDSTDRLSLSDALQTSTLSFKSLHVECPSGGSVLWDVSPLDPFLNVLRLSGCAVEKVTDDQRIVMPPRLWVLELQGVPAEVADSLDFSQASQLQTLSLTHSRLSSLPRHWSQHVLRSLWFISLAHNNLSTYECELKSPRLQTISLDFNNLAALPQCVLDGSKYSSHLSLRHNQINSLQELTVSKSELVPAPPVVPQIMYLDLAYNQVESVRSLKKTQWLLGLDLSYNQLDNVASDSFSLHPHLVVLDLSNNFLEYVGDGLLSSLVSVKHLNLSYNYLRSFDFDHDALNLNLKTLDLRHNRLIYPPFADLGYVVPRGLHISAALNPFLCDCNIYPFLQQHGMVNSNQRTVWSRLRSVYTLTARVVYVQPFVDINELTCGGPLGLKGVRLTSVDFQKACPLPRGCPKDCRCKLMKDGMRYVSVDCSQTGSLSELPESVPFVADAPLVLYINQTRVRRLDHRPYLSHVRELHADHSRLSSVTPDALKALENVSILDLHSAQLRSLPAITQHLPLLAVTHLALSDNPWACSCRDLWMPAWLAKHAAAICDINHVRCRWTGKLVTDLSPSDLNCGPLDYLPVTIALSLLTGLLLLILSFLLKYKLEFLVFIYKHSGLRPFDMFKYDQTKPSLFDIFVSFSDMDYKWVVEDLMEHLEDQYRPHQLCTHLRDFPAGAPLANSVTWATENSRCTLLVLTRDLLSEWKKRPNVRAAHLHLLQEDPDRLLVVIHGPVDARNLGPQLLAHLRGSSRTYLKSDEAWFWPKLDYALPKPQKVIVLKTRASSFPKEREAAGGGGKEGGERNPLAQSSSTMTEIGNSCVLSKLLASGDITPRKARVTVSVGGGARSCSE